ncbi:hypothetical protein CSA17_04735 [bacterium DOLJORAL78_65_58]|nr:MAG: hypothetical protein CSB20_01740 [bacterium DOLZORAL124_64_63]PIE75962.1 MAG: hypothetical protein CSA17_04735 [bacterium DOLJORAL78_65_58]
MKRILILLIILGLSGPSFAEMMDAPSRRPVTWEAPPELVARADTTGYSHSLQKILDRDETMAAAQRKLARSRCAPWLGAADSPRSLRSRLAHGFIDKVNSLFMSEEDDHSMRQECLQALEAAAVLYPADPEIVLALGHVESWGGDYWRSLGYYRQAARLAELLAERGRPLKSGLELDIWNSLIWCQLDLGLWSSAEAAVERVLALDPEHKGARVAKGLILAETGRGAEAMSYAIRMPPLKFWKISLSMGFSDRPSGFANQWIKSRVLFHEGKFRMAVTVLGDLRGEMEQPWLPFRRRYWNDVGLIHEMLDDGQAGSFYNHAGMRFSQFMRTQGQTCSELVTRFPRPNTPVFMGEDGYYLSGSPFGFVAEQVRQMSDPENREAYLRGLDAVRIMRARGVPEGLCLAFRGRLRFLNGDYSEAISDLSRAREGFQADGEVDAGTITFLGVAYLTRGQNEQAREVLEEAVALDADNPNLRGYLGVAWARTGKPLRALELMDEALLEDPAAATIWFNRGLLNAELQRWDQALSDLRKAYELDPDNARIPIQLQRVSRARQAALQVSASP